jgi:hypothetical protein
LKRSGPRHRRITEASWDGAKAQLLVTAERRSEREVQAAAAMPGKRDKLSVEFIVVDSSSGHEAIVFSPNAVGNPPVAKATPTIFRKRLTKRTAYRGKSSVPRAKNFLCPQTGTAGECLEFRAAAPLER